MYKRQGIEKVNAQIVDDFYAKMIDDLQKKPREAKYMNGSDDLFTEIFRIYGKFNRVAIYPSNIPVSYTHLDVYKRQGGYSLFHQ